MTTPDTTEAPQRAKSGIVRRVAAALIVGLVFFVVLWITVFNAMNAALVSSGGAIVLVAGSGASDLFQSIFDAITEIIFAILGAIADFLSAIFDIFN